MRNSQVKLVLLVSVLLILTVVSVAWAESTVVLKLDPDRRFQTIEGFGASIGWYDGWLTVHPNREGIYDAIFSELGLDILRLQNWYGKQDKFGLDYGQIVEAGRKRMGDDLKILISSWAPPADLKSNNRPDDGGTLKKQDGQYVYELFADYWYDSLQTYAKLGIVADYISIQNEPDFEAEWNCNMLSAEETDDIAGYPQALDAVYNRLQAMDSPPKILGPEVVGVGYGVIQDYLNNMNLDQIYGIAYHLYHGGTHHAIPDSYNSNLLRVAKEYPNIPVFQTEYEAGDGYDTVRIIHNTLVYGNASAYLYWDLVWDDSGLVAMEFPWDRGRWQTEEGYYRTERYYAFKHYSKHISDGYQRIAVSTSRGNPLRVSAFISPDESEITLVIINTGDTKEHLVLELDHHTITGSRTYLTEFGLENGAVFGDLGPLGDNADLTMPNKSVITLVLEIE